MAPPYRGSIKDSPAVPSHRAPDAGELLAFTQEGSRVNEGIVAVDEGPPLADSEIGNGPHIGSCQRVHEIHVCRPRPDAAHRGQTLDDVLVGHRRALLHGRHGAGKAALREVAHGGRVGGGTGEADVGLRGRVAPHLQIHRGCDEHRCGCREHERGQERGAQEEEEDLMPLDADMIIRIPHKISLNMVPHYLYVALMMLAK